MSTQRKDLAKEGEGRRRCGFLLLFALFAFSLLLSTVTLVQAFDIGAPPRISETENQKSAPPTVAPKRPSDSLLFEKKQRQQKVIDAVKEFYRSMGNQDLANKIGEWYDAGKIEFGMPDKGSAYYSGGKILVHEGIAEGVLDKNGLPDAGNLSSLASSIFHEFIHSGQGVVEWASSVWGNSFGAGQTMEYEAYFKTLAAMASWISLQKKKMGEMPAGATPCYRAVPARDIEKLCGEFETYWSNMKGMDLGKRPAVKKERLETYEKIAVLDRECSDYRKGDVSRDATACFDLEELKKKAASLDEKINDDWLDLDAHSWKAQDGKTLSNEEVAQYIASVRQEMKDIVKQCEKENFASKDCAGLADKEKSKLFGDLCWCSCSPTTGGGSKYEGARGCVCSGVLGGEWTVPMITSGECFKSSTASVGASEDSCRKVITDMNRQWAEKLIQMAKDLIEDFFTPLPGLSQGKKAAKKAPETQKERVERKLNEGDLDRAAGYTKAAAEMYPPLESSARAVIPGTLPWRLTKLALTFVPPLEFGTARRLLERTSRLDEKNQHVKENLSKVIQWEKEWNQIKSLSEECFSDIKAKRVCECQRLFDGKIEPLNKSFNIPTGRAVEVTFERSPDEVRWGAPKLGTRSVMEQTPIPEKDALRGKLVLELDNARRGCRYQSGLAETVGVLEAYISDRARPGRTDQAIADMAKKVLERKGLCDCERELAEKATEIADKWIAEQGPPLKVSLQAAKTVMKKGESVELSPVISGGRPPYNFSYTGYWAFDVIGGAISGQGQTTTLLRAKMVGAQTLDVNVTDAKGQKASGRIVLNVIEDTASKPPGQTTMPSKLDVSLMAEKSMLKTGESAYITAAVTGGKPPYKIKWSGASSGEGPTILFKAQRPGSNSVHAEVQDSLGNKGSADIVLNVGAGKTSVKETTDNGSKVNKTGKVGKSKIIELGSKPETSPSPLKLKVPQGEQTRTLVFTYQHKRVDTGKMEYVFPPPAASSYRIEPSDSGASVTRISNPAKWGKEKLFAVKINKDVKPGRKFTLTADYIGIPLPPGSTSRYLDTGEDADEYLRKHVKSAAAVIEVIAGKATSDIGNTGYDPTADPNTGGSGSKDIDIAQVDKFGDDFRNITKGSKQGDPKTDKPQAPVQQPDTYTTSVKKTDTSGEQSTYTQPPYPPVSSSDWGKDRTDWTKKWGDKGSQGYGSDTLVDSSSTKRKCDAAQKQAAYQDGVKCGQKARQNNGNMTSECITLSQGHMNRDNQLGWGSCLYSGFDEGYRAGLGTTSGDVAGAVIAELENRSGENVHIFAEGQENFSPQNRLAPGEKRKVNIKVPKAGGFVKFIAGRNGQKLAECKWEFSPGSSTRVPVVKFSDPGSLTCVTGLR